MSTSDMGDEINISLAESAVKDLEDILKYYEEQKAPHVGRRLVNKILEDIESLKNQPDMGRMVPEFELNKLRELIRPPFRIVYLREPSKIKIVRVWRSERLLILP